MHIDFPYRIDGRGRTAGAADRRDYVRKLIDATLFTAPGERVNRPEFGTGLNELVFAPNSDALAAATEMMVRSALQTHLAEYVMVEELLVEADDETLRITLTYSVRGEGERVTEAFERPVP